jgi:hypothetical protein
MVTVAVERAAVWPPPAPAGGAMAREPDVGFLPPMLRRRCSRLTRMMLHVAYDVCPADRRSTLPIVFASRYGEAGATLGLLEALARREPLTAGAFSHSVHNTQAGIFGISTRNRAMASAVAAGLDTFGAAFLEAVVAAHRGGGEALLVVADEPLPGAFARFQEEPPLPYAVALLLGAAGVRVDFAPGVGTPRPDPSHRDALRFVGWIESTEPRLTLGAATPYTWTRR